MASWHNPPQRGWRYTKNLLHIHRKYLSLGQTVFGRHGQAKKKSSKQDNVSLHGAIDNNNNNNANKNYKKKMRALVLQGGGAIGAFQLALSGHYMKRLQKKTRKMEMKEGHYLTLSLGLQLVR